MRLESALCLGLHEGRHDVSNVIGRDVITNAGQLAVIAWMR